MKGEIMVKQEKYLEVSQQTQQLFTRYLTDFQRASSTDQQIYSFIAKEDLMSLEKEKSSIKEKLAEYQNHKSSIMFLKNFSMKAKLYYWQMELSTMELTLVQDQIQGIITFVNHMSDVNYATMKLQAREKELFDRNKEAFIKFRDNSNSSNHPISFNGKYLFSAAKQTYQQGKNLNKLLIRK